MDNIFIHGTALDAACMLESKRVGTKVVLTDRNGDSSVVTKTADEKAQKGYR